MTKTKTESEVILEVAGEGGGYTILGERSKDHWLFWLGASSGDSWMYDEDDSDVGSNISMPTQVEEPIHYNTLDGALDQINSGWPRLHPIVVHPDFAMAVMERVKKYLNDGAVPNRDRVASRWQHVCSGNKSDIYAPLVPRKSLPTLDVPEHWQKFCRALSSTLAALEQDQYLILLEKGSNRFVQFSMQTDCLRAEVTSNQFLSGSDSLSNDEIASLERLGWKQPNGIPSEATPENAIDGSPNYFVELSMPHNFSEIAVLAVQTLEQALAAPHDGCLTYVAFDATRGDLVFPGLGIERQTQPEKLNMGDLADSLLEILKDVSGDGTIGYDDSGSIGFHIGDQEWQINLVGMPPVVRFYMPIRIHAQPGEQLLGRLNQLNAHSISARFFLANNIANAVLDIPAWPLQANHIKSGFEQFTDSVSKSAIWLQTELEEE